MATVTLAVIAVLVAALGGTYVAWRLSARAAYEAEQSEHASGTSETAADNAPQADQQVEKSEGLEAQDAEQQRVETQGTRQQRVEARATQPQTPAFPFSATADSVPLKGADEQAFVLMCAQALGVPTDQPGITYQLSEQYYWEGGALDLLTIVFRGPDGYQASGECTVEDGPVKGLFGWNQV